MTSITRTALCTTKGCPQPRSPEWHIPWCGHGMEGHHQHWPKRSRGGKEIVAFLCPNCHHLVDNTVELTDRVVTMGNRTRWYSLWRNLETTDPKAIQSVVEPRCIDPWEGNDGQDLDSRGVPEERGALLGAGHAGVSHESADVPAVVQALPTVAMGEQAAEHRVGESWESRGRDLCEQGRTLKQGSILWHWEVGSWLNEGEKVLGKDEAWSAPLTGLLGQITGGYEMLRKAQRFAGAFEQKAVERYARTTLTYTHLIHALPLQQTSPDEAERALVKAADSHTPSREFAAGLRGGEPVREKRWSVEELREQRRFMETDSGRTLHEVEWFLDELKEQG